MLVETVAFPCDNASSSLILIPLPTSSGTTHTAARSCSSSSDSTAPSSATPRGSGPVHRSRTVPTTASVASGTRSSTRGHTSASSQRNPCTFGTLFDATSRQCAGSGAPDATPTFSPIGCTSTSPLTRPRTASASACCTAITVSAPFSQAASISGEISLQSSASPLSRNNRTCSASTSCITMARCTPGISRSSAPQNA